MVLFYNYKFSKMGIQRSECIFFAWDLKGCLKAHQNILLLFFHVGCFFSRSSCSHPFSQGLHEADNFWQQPLMKNNYFFGRRRSEFQSFTLNVFISQFWLQPPSFGIGYLLLSLKEWQWFILWSVLHLFWRRENLQSSCLSNSFSSNVYLVKKVGSSYAFSQKYYN